MDMTKYTAGFARLDITPFLGMAMAGSWNARGVLLPSVTARSLLCCWWRIW